MGIGDYNIENMGGKRERLKDVKNATRIEQLAKRLQIIASVYDTNHNGTIEQEELAGIFADLKHIAGLDNDKNTLHEIEGFLSNEEFSKKYLELAKESGMKEDELKELSGVLQNAHLDFYGFVKELSDLSESVVSTETGILPDGGKVVTTEYSDGVTEILGYYPDGSFKFKKTIRQLSNTKYTMEIDKNQVELTKEQYDELMKKPEMLTPEYYNLAPQSQVKPLDGQFIQFTQRNPEHLAELYNVVPMLQYSPAGLGGINTIKLNTTTYKEPKSDVELSEAAAKDAYLRDFALSHYLEGYASAKTYLDDMGPIDKIAAALNDLSALEDKTERNLAQKGGAGVSAAIALRMTVNPLKGLYRMVFGTEATNEELKTFYYGIKERFEKNYNKTLELDFEPNLQKAQADNSVYFTELEDLFRNNFQTLDTKKLESFQKATTKYQMASVLDSRISILRGLAGRMFKINQSLMEAELNPHKSGFSKDEIMVACGEMEELIKQYCGNDETLYDEFITSTGMKNFIGGTISESYVNCSIARQNLQELLKIQEAQRAEVAGDTPLEDLQKEYLAQYKEVFGEENLPEDLNTLITDAKMTAGMTKLVAVVIITALITKQINAAVAAGTAGEAGVLATTLRTFASAHPRLFAEAMRAFSVGTTIVTDTGLEVLNAALSENGLTDEKWSQIKEAEVGNAAFMAFAAYAASPIARNLSKLPGGKNLFKGGEVVASEGAMTTTRINGADLAKNAYNTNSSFWSVASEFGIEVGLFTGFEALTSGVDVEEAASNQTEMLSKIKIMNHFVEYMLGARAHVKLQQTKLDAAIKRAGLSDYTFEEIKNPNRTQYKVICPNGETKVISKKQLLTMVNQSVGTATRANELSVQFKVSDELSGADILRSMNPGAKGGARIEGLKVKKVNDDLYKVTLADGKEVTVEKLEDVLGLTSNLYGLDHLETSINTRIAKEGNISSLDILKLSLGDISGTLKVGDKEINVSDILSENSALSEVKIRRVEFEGKEVYEVQDGGRTLRLSTLEEVLQLCDKNLQKQTIMKMLDVNAKELKAEQSEVSENERIDNIPVEDDGAVVRQETTEEIPPVKTDEVPLKASKPVSEMTEAEMIARYNELSKTGEVGEELLTLTFELQEKGYRFGQDGKLDFDYNPSGEVLPNTEMSKSELLKQLKERGVAQGALDVIEYNANRINFELLEAVGDPRLINESLGTIFVDVKPEDVPAKIEMLKALKNADALSVENQFNLIAETTADNVETITKRVEQINSDINYLKQAGVDAKVVDLYSRMMCETREIFSREMFDLVKDNPELVNTNVCFTNDAANIPARIEAYMLLKDADMPAYVKKTVLTRTTADTLERIKIVEELRTQDEGVTVDVINQIYRDIDRLDLKKVSETRELLEYLEPREISSLSAEDLSAKKRTLELLKDKSVDKERFLRSTNKDNIAEVELQLMVADLPETLKEGLLKRLEYTDVEILKAELAEDLPLIHKYLKACNVKEPQFSEAEMVQREEILNSVRQKLREKFGADGEPNMERVFEQTKTMEELNARYQMFMLLRNANALNEFSNLDVSTIKIQEQVDLAKRLNLRNTAEISGFKFLENYRFLKLYDELCQKTGNKPEGEIIKGIAQGFVTDLSSIEIIEAQIKKGELQKLFTNYKNGVETYGYDCNREFSEAKLKEIFPGLDFNRLNKVSAKNLYLLYLRINDCQGFTFAELENAINNAPISSLAKRQPILEELTNDTAFHLAFCSDVEFDRAVAVLERRPEILDKKYDFKTFKKLIDMSDMEWQALKVPIRERNGSNFKPEQYTQEVQDLLNGGFSLDLDTWNGIERRRMLVQNSGLGQKPGPKVAFDESKPLVHPDRPVPELPTTEALMAELASNGRVTLDIVDAGGKNPAHTDPAIIKDKDRPYLDKVQNTDTSVKIGETRAWENDRLARDLLQNFYDGNGYTLEGVKISVEQKNGKYVVKITGDGIFDYDRVLDFGATSKEGNSRSAGRHGEGSKVIAGNLLCAKGAGYVRYTSGDWVLDLGVSEPNSLGERLITKKISQAPERLEGTTYEFETTDAGLVESILKAKDFFYNPANRDFANFDFENDFFGIKFLPKGEKGNVYVVQRFEVEGKEGLEATIDGMTLVFKRQPHDADIKAANGEKDYSLATGRNRVALSEKQITEMIDRYARTLSDEQLTNIIGNMRDVFLFDNKSKNTHILEGFTFAALARGLKIDFGHNDYIAVPRSSSEADLEWVRKYGKTPVTPDMQFVGVPRLYDFKKANENQLCPKMDLTETQQKKLQILSEAVRMFSSHLDFENSDIITEGEANAPKYVVENIVDTGALGCDVQAQAIVRNEGYAGHWVQERYLNEGSFFDMVATWLHETSHKVNGDGTKSFNERLIKLQQLIVDISSTDPSFGQQLRILKQEFDKLNGRETFGMETPSDIQLSEIEQNISDLLRKTVERAEADAAAKAAAEAGAAQTTKPTGLKKLYNRMFGKRSETPAPAPAVNIVLSERVPLEPKSSRPVYTSPEPKTATKSEKTAATLAENMETLKQNGAVSIEIPAPNGLKPKISDTSILPEDRELLGVEQNTSLRIDYNSAQEWSKPVIARDLFQNFFDGHNGTLDGVKVEVTQSNGRYKIRISGQSEYNYFYLKTISASNKTADVRAAGGFGEGAKMACKTLLGAGLTDKVTFASGDWAMDFAREEGVPRKEQHLTRKLSENSQRVDGTYVEFETTDLEMVRAMLEGKDYFAHSENPDFQKFDFENEDFGFRVLPEGEKGNLYYVQRYAIREKGNLEGALDGISIVFKRGLSADEKSRAGLKDDPDRKGLSSDEIEGIAQQMAESMSNEQLLNAIQALERFWVVEDLGILSSYSQDKLSVEKMFTLGLIKCAQYRYGVDARFDTKDAKLAAVNFRTDKRDMDFLRSLGYKFIRPEMENLGFRTVESFMHEINEVKPVEETIVEKQKLALMNEVLPEGVEIKVFESATGREPVRFVNETRNQQYIAVDRNYLSNADFNTLYTEILSQANKKTVDGKRITDADWGYSMTEMIAKQLELSQNPEFMAKFRVAARRFGNIGKY